MSIIFRDSFDHYGTDTANALRSGWNVFARPISSAQARTGTHSVRITPNSTLGLYLERAFDMARATVCVGAAYRFDAAPTDPERTLVSGFLDSAGNSQMSLTLNNAGFLELKLGGASAAEVATASAPVTFLAWQHIEFKLTPLNSGGTAEVRLNGQTVISYTGDTQATANADALEWRTGVNANSAASYYLDDVIAATDFEGDKRVYTLFPDGDTATADLVPNSGSTGYSQIDEAAPDDDTNYVGTSNPTAESRYTFGNLPAGVGAIADAAVIVLARKDDAGTCTFRSGLRSGSSTSNGGAQAPTTSYAGYVSAHATDPATGLAWSPAGLNAAQVKLERLT